MYFLRMSTTRPMYQITQKPGLFSDGKSGEASGSILFPFPPRKGLIPNEEGTMSFSKELPLSHPWASRPGSRLVLFGACLSVMCLAHCALLPMLPLLLAGLPWLADEQLHLGLLALITPVALISFFRGTRRHGRKTVLFWGCAALLLLLMGPIAGEALEKPLTVFGSLMLCGAHLKNRKELLRG